MNKSAKRTTTIIVREESKSGSVTPYTTVEVNNNEKTIDMPSIAIKAVKAMSNSLLSFRFPKDWRLIAYFP